MRETLNAVEGHAVLILWTIRAAALFLVVYLVAAVAALLETER